MTVYFAPLEGVTDAVFRRIHHAQFSGVSKYFIPFISPTQNLCFTNRELSAITPEQNEGVPVVPQVLTKHAEHFIWAANELAAMGYTEVNLNAGCPSGTVTAKGKGAGMLTDLSALERFLDEVFEKTPLPVSIKTRIGFTSPSEFERICELLIRYPFCEAILHPRTRKEFYKGIPHRDVYAALLAAAPFPVVYNGDLFSCEDCRRLNADFPGTHAVMLGRGLIANPALAQTLSGSGALTLPMLRTFYDSLLAAYKEIYPPHVVLGRMKEIMAHMVCCFEAPEKPRKTLRKASTLDAFESAVDTLFLTHPLCDEPMFTA